MQEKYKEHIKKSNEARNQLKQDQIAPKEDETKVAVTFDLQKTLLTPKIKTGIAFYTRYNFWCTILEFMLFKLKMIPCK